MDQKTKDLAAEFANKQNQYFVSCVKSILADNSKANCEKIESIESYIKYQNKELAQWERDHLTDED